MFVRLEQKNVDAMNDAAWDNMWGGGGAGGGGAPRRAADGGVIANLRGQPTITRHSESPAQAEMRRRKQEQLRKQLDGQLLSLIHI